MTNQSNFSTLKWKETSPGRYEREIDEQEQFYSTLAKLYEGIGRTYFAITGYVECFVLLSFGDSVSDIEDRVETALRKAWKKLRYDHPTIASVVEYHSSTKECRKVYQSLENGDAAEEWLTASFKPVNNGQTGLEFCNSDPPVNHCATLFVISPPADVEGASPKSLRRDIVFRSTHDLIDGIGTLTLLDNLFHHAAEAYTLGDDYPDAIFGDEYKNLSPVFKIAAGLPLVPSQVHTDKVQAIMAANNAAKENIDIISHPFSVKSSTPGKNQRAMISMTESETQAVLEKSRSLGVTVTQAFHAGIAVAVFEMQERGERERKGRYINYSLVNLRGFCKPPYNSPQHAASVYHSISGKSLVVDFDIPAKSSSGVTDPTRQFSSVLSVVNKFYLDVKLDPDYLGMASSFMIAGLPQYPEQTCSVPPYNKSPSVSISSMGILERIIQPQHGPFSLNEPWVTADEYSTGLGVFLGTWNGAMSLSCGYNEAYHSQEEVIEYLEHVKRVVFGGLGINIA